MKKINIDTLIVLSTIFTWVMFTISIFTSYHSWGSAGLFIPVGLLIYMIYCGIWPFRTRR